MDLSLLSPLDYYTKTAKAEHKKNCEERFDALVAASGMDIEANRAAAKKYREQLAKIDALNKKIRNYKILRGFMIALAVAGIIPMLFSGDSSLPTVWRVLLPIIGLAVIATSLILIFAKLNKLIRHFDEVCDREEEEAKRRLAEANALIAPLIALFRSSDTHRLIEKTVPELKFEERLTTSLVEDMAENYDFYEDPEEKSSVLETVSGRFFENPFFYERKRVHTMGTETYRGSIVIHWTTRSRGSDGKMHTNHHTQTLTASVTKPKPYYAVRTSLHYGNQAAPDLSFSRDAGHVERLTERQLENRIEDGEKKIAERARDALEDGESFTEMTNSEFEVLFDALDRDHEQQFRVLYTPLAQTDTVKLLRSTEGYGDDFTLRKRRRHNTVESEHAAGWEMEAHISNYVSYDYDICREKYISFNEGYFKSVYFDFAPLLTIPAYQHAPVPSLAKLKCETNFTHKEYEALANGMSPSYLVHPETATEAIIKAENVATFGDTDRIEVTAYSFGAVRRTDFIPVFGGDGRMHNVPVPWIEYYPLVATSQLEVRGISGVSAEEFAERRDELSVVTDLAAVSFKRGLLARLTTSGATLDDISRIVTAGKAHN